MVRTHVQLLQFLGGANRLAADIRDAESECSGRVLAAQRFCSVAIDATADTAHGDADGT